MTRFLALILGLALAGGALRAQSGCSVTVTPSSAPLGQAITVTLHNNTASTIYLPSSCVIGAIHAGGAGGPIVFSPGCLTVITPLPPFSSRSQTWSQRDNYDQQVPPGTYLVAVAHPNPCTAQLVILPCARGSFSTLGSGCGAGALGVPTLAAEACPALGGPFALSVARGNANLPVLLGLGASSTTWAGVPLPLALGGGCYVRVSHEVLLRSTANFMGFARFDLPVPMDPSLRGAVLYAQAYLPAAARLDISNALALTIG
jgi:hypothetical protein